MPSDNGSTGPFRSLLTLPELSREVRQLRVDVDALGGADLSGLVAQVEAQLEQALSGQVQGLNIRMSGAEEDIFAFREMIDEVLDTSNQAKRVADAVLANQQGMEDRIGNISANVFADHDALLDLTDRVNAISGQMLTPEEFDEIRSFKGEWDGFVGDYYDASTGRWNFVPVLDDADIVSRGFGALGVDNVGEWADDMTSIRSIFTASPFVDMNRVAGCRNMLTAWMDGGILDAQGISDLMDNKLLFGQFDEFGWILGTGPASIFEVLDGLKKKLNEFAGAKIGLGNYTAALRDDDNKLAGLVAAPRNMYKDLTKGYYVSVTGWGYADSAWANQYKYFFKANVNSEAQPPIPARDWPGSYVSGKSWETTGYYPNRIQLTQGIHEIAKRHGDEVDAWVKSAGIPLEIGLQMKAYMSARSVLRQVVVEDVDFGSDFEIGGENLEISSLQNVVHDIRTGGQLGGQQLTGIGEIHSGMGSIIQNFPAPL